ncbi:dual oxidase maturation factor 1-like [Mytilus galloprovincialis]|uniref:dual oxidase maturation factor 1-like n=1 Tax=Mytilus galloprovincialis TaxID=29158 RepID=UPI003F7BCB43
MDGVIPAGIFNAFRTNGAPTYYGPNQTPFEADILESGFIFAFVILAISFFVVLPGIRGKERLFVFIRVTVTLFIGGVIMLANLSMEWETAELKNVPTKYKAGENREIHADIKVHIGFRGINITMKGEPEIQLNETINYNEHFDWRWEQGRFGFGIFAGRFNREYREAQFRGLPLPILWIAEYFTFDGEGIRWGRHYRQAGWYSHIMMWLALPLWFLTIILFFVLLKYGAYFLMLTGGVMVIANILWSTIRNFNELEIPLASDHVLKFKYGGAYYVNLITGVLCVLIGAIIWLMDLRFPSVIASFFGVDVLQDEFDDATVEEDTSTSKSVKDEPDQNGMEMRGMSSKNKSQGATADDEEEESDDEIYEAPTFAQQPAMMTSIKKQRFTKRVGLQAPRRRPPPPIPGEDPDEDYENVSRPDQVRLNMGYH